MSACPALSSVVWGKSWTFMLPSRLVSAVGYDNTRTTRASAIATVVKMACGAVVSQGTTMAKQSSKTGQAKTKAKPRPSAAAGDDTGITALTLEPATLSPDMAAYFAKCEEKLGFVPNVLKAYGFDMAKLSAFVGMYNDLMLAPSGLSKLEREMIAVAVSSHNRCYYCLVAHGAAVRQLSGDPVLGELMAMNFRAA